MFNNHNIKGHFKLEIKNPWQIPWQYSDSKGKGPIPCQKKIDRGSHGFPWQTTTLILSVNYK